MRIFLDFFTPSMGQWSRPFFCFNDFQSPLPNHFSQSHKSFEGDGGGAIPFFPTYPSLSLLPLPPPCRTTPFLGGFSPNESFD